MPGEQLFEDYDPDMEDVFGHRTAMTPKRVIVTEKQRTDPLRKPKVELQGILVAEKQPITSKDIERRMLNEYGQVMDPKKYGCDTLDDLLQACSDTIVHQRRRDGVHVYMAKVSEANQDIVEMVQQQLTGNEVRRAPRSFLTTSSSRGFGNHGASFRNYQVTRISDDVPKARGTHDQIRARTKLGPSKTTARLQNLADLLKECRDEIGISHPEKPNRKIVTLGALVEKFKLVYGLPAWGKNMTESDLYKQIDVPEFAGVLFFWRLREDGDIFVEEDDKAVETPEPAQISPTTTSPAKLAQLTSPEDQHEESATPSPDLTITPPRPLSSVLADNSYEEFSSIDASDCSMLITKENDVDFFQSGPGFGGNISQQVQPSDNASTAADIAKRFGNTSFGADKTQSIPGSTSVSRTGSRQEAASSSNKREERSISRARSTQGKPMRPTANSAAHAFRAIIPQNPVKILADYVKSRGSVKFDSLPEDDQSIVNFGKNIFKVYSEQPGEMKVRLVDVDIDTSTLTMPSTLRDPLEADFRWMSEASVHVKRNRRHFVKPVMFVAPRGFLMMTSNTEEEDADGDKMAIMEELLRGAMNASVKELTRKKVRPGMPAVYIYSQGSEVRYYRVLVVGRAHQDGDLMVLLADHSEQYLADVQFSHLFELPERVDFKHYSPNVIFATIFGVGGLSLNEQENVFKNVDDEERKQFIVGYVPDDQSKNLTIDTVWRENGTLDWLSRILKRRGAVVSSDSNSAHLLRQPYAAIESFGPDCVMDFIDYSTDSTTPNRTQNEEVSEIEGRIIPLYDESIISEINADNGLTPRSLNLYKLFDKLISEQNVVSVVSMAQFVRGISDSMHDTDEWNDILAYITEVGRRNNIRL